MNLLRIPRFVSLESSRTAALCLLLAVLTPAAGLRADFASGGMQLTITSPGSPSGIYTIDPDGAGGAAPFDAYIDTATFGGGWTLLARMDGATSTWNYNSALWTDATTLNTASPGIGAGNFKSAGFSTMSFSQVMIALDDGSGLRYLALSVSSSSLSALFSGGTVSIPGTVPAYAALLGMPRSQSFVAGSGINVDPSPITSTDYAAVRVGIVTNNEVDIFTPDSFIGLGGLYQPNAFTSAYSAGAFALTGTSVGSPGYTAATGYLFIRDTMPFNPVPEPRTCGIAFALLVGGIAARRALRKKLPAADAPLS